MNPENVVKDDEGKVATWFDMKKKYDVKANSVNRPRFVSSAINGFPGIDFTGANIGLVSDVKYSKAPGHPFTWIMAVLCRIMNCIRGIVCLIKPGSAV